MPPDPMTDPTPATPDEAVALGHPEARCQSCGGRNVVWHAPNPLWNAAVRRQDGSETFGILCPPCFVSVYEDSTGDRGQVWCLHPHDHEHLSRPAPDGAAALHDVLATAIHGSKSLSHKMRHPRGPEPRCWDEALAVLAFLPDGVRLAVVPEGSSVVSVEDVTSLASHLLPLSRQAPDGAVAARVAACEHEWVMAATRLVKDETGAWLSEPVPVRRWRCQVCGCYATEPEGIGADGAGDGR